MKYMGSKRYMLKNGLAELIRSQGPKFERIIDIFSGSGAVVWFVSENLNKETIAVDLQAYGAVMANAVISRTAPLDDNKLIKNWILKSKNNFLASDLWQACTLIEKSSKNTKSLVKKSRVLCSLTKSNIGPVWGAYGGHYYSPKQALAIDYLLKNLPKKEPERSLCLGSLISTASKCAASPGHTAQPFQPTEKAEKFIVASWKMDPFSVCEKVLKEINQRYARKKGTAFVADALDVIPKLTKKDLVIIDPPYSGVQYSRFYHVLETIARGHVGKVEGAGRYPIIEERPQSEFSNKGQAKLALEKLFASLAAVKCSVIFTFPVKECSNGLSGEMIQKLAEKWFEIKEKRIHGHFSTMGGNKINRDYRQKSEELLLYLKPKS